MKHFHQSKILLSVLLLAAGQFCAPAVEPLRALMITGGGTHDYEHQKKLIAEGISARANVVWTIVDESSEKTHEVTVYGKPDWSKGFDIIVHDECFGKVTNAAYVDKIAAGHATGVASMVLHCSIHAYRDAKTDEWRKVLGVSSNHHEKARAFKVVNLKPEHPVMKGFPATWQDYPDELYVIDKQWPNFVALAEAEGAKEGTQPCIWVNTYHEARVFGTTLGHSNQTVSDPVYLDLLTRGLLWACDKLDEKGKPKPGYGKP